MSTKCVLNLHHSTSLRGNYADIATLGFFEEKFSKISKTTKRFFCQVEVKT